MNKMSYVISLAVISGALSIGGCKADSGKKANILVDSPYSQTESKRVRDLSLKCRNDHDLDACVEAANAYSMPPEITFVENSPAMAKAFYTKACEGEQIAGCLGLAKTADDLETSRNIARETCENLYAAGCAYLSSLLIMGPEEGRNYEASLKAARLACANNFKNCHPNGDIYRNGGVVPKNDKVARWFFVKGCENGDIMSCRDGGGMMERGEGGAQDLKSAASMYQKVCQATQDKNCLLVQSLDNPTSPE